MKYISTIADRLRDFFPQQYRKAGYLSLTVLIVILIVTISSQAGKNDIDINDHAKAVKVMKTAERQYSASLNYIGTVESEELVKYSFKTAGQIKRIYVSEGDQVKVGQVLAELDTTDLDFQQAAARDNSNIASANISKAEDALVYADSLYEKAKTLYEAGAVSKDYFDQVELKRNTAESDYQQAVAQHSAASTDYGYKSDLLNNSVLYAEQDGYIAQKISNEFERVGAYAPVLVVRSEEEVVNIGIPQQELAQVKLGSSATIHVDGDFAIGAVTNISELPDATTRTYNAEVSIPDKTFPFGAIAEVSVEIGYLNGIWIPFTAIFSDDGGNCVYVIHNDRALKRTIEIQNIKDDMAMVTGLEKGESLIISGRNNLDDGTKVKIQNQE